MAMEGPGSGVVSLVLEDHVTTSLDKLHITTLGVGGVDNGSVPSAEALIEKEHVVAVEMDGVGGESRVVDHDSDRGVGTEVVHVPLRRVGIRVIAQVREK